MKSVTYTFRSEWKFDYVWEKTSKFPSVASLWREDERQKSLSIFTVKSAANWGTLFPAIQGNFSKRFDGKSCRLVRRKVFSWPQNFVRGFSSCFSPLFCMWRALALDWRSDEFFMKNTNYLRVDGWEFASLQNQFERQQQRGVAGTWMENFYSCSIVLVIGSAIQCSAIARVPMRRWKSLFFSFSLLLAFLLCHARLDGFFS